MNCALSQSRNATNRQQETSTYLVAVIADGVVSEVAARVGLLLEVLGDLGAKDSRLKGVLGVVAVDVLLEAGVAEVKVLAVLAVEEVGGRVFYRRKNSVRKVANKRQIPRIWTYPERSRCRCGSGR
jgi:hypothetical protein